ncbi:unnamed protein product [Adineta steineri]|uniref:Uncharacterized protein n=1 Tax=Adineta steineri TaxID=433720 RepID=A0A814LJD5_9BILA|nr:unnamed protein product [Adineta steineri]CAF4090228.1 unnamed protein product [Adineta steineri]
MSIADTLSLVRQFMTRYILSTIVAFGSLDHIILSQQQRRSNSCSIYLLAISFFVADSGLSILNNASQWLVRSSRYSYIP